MTSPTMRPHRPAASRTLTFLWASGYVEPQRRPLIQTLGGDVGRCRRGQHEHLYGPWPPDGSFIVRVARQVAGRERGQGSPFPCP